jgi:hypothetical protein
VAIWQQRPLDPVYPLVFFDALRVKIRDEGMVRNKAIHIALGVRADGAKEVLGLWLEQNEGAKFWLRVMNELRNRGTEDILLAVVDGLKGFPEAITAVFPDAVVQTCIVHLLRNSMDFVSRKDRKGPGDCVEGDLPRAQCRGGRAGPDCVRGGSLGNPLSRHCPELAGAPGPRSSRSSPFPTRFGGSSTPPTPSRR